MPFEQKYTDETREQSLARVLERREAEPGNRAIIRETAEQFEVGEQSLRGWIRAWEKANAPAASVIPRRRPTPPRTARPCASTATRRTSRPPPGAASRSPARQRSGSAGGDRRRRSRRRARGRGRQAPSRPRHAQGAPSAVLVGD